MIVEPIEKRLKRNIIFGLTLKAVIIIFFLLFCLFLSVGISNSMDTKEDSIGISIFSLICLFFTIFFWLKTNRYINKFKEYQRYFNLIMVQNIHSMEQLADVERVNQQKVMSIVGRMINSKYIIGLKIDFDRLVLIPMEQYTTKNLKSVLCSACGARNNIKEGSDGACEFCGAYLPG